tara:strand:- start:951 stop:1409 length:459 start_codon:yes stop_codon:yes gene_type:complete
MNPERLHPAEDKIREISHQTKKLGRRSSWKMSQNFLTSLFYAFKGISHGFQSQRNFRIQVGLASCTFLLGVWLQLNFANLAIIVLTVALVLSLELINTALEAVVDLSIGRRFHPLAQIAKDCAAGAVLISAMSSFLVAILLLLPPLLIRLGI